MSDSDNYRSHAREHSQPKGLAVVFGASGYIGSNLVPYLRHRGIPVRACARNLAVLEGRNWHGVECIAADALQAGSLGDALRGADTAYYLVHSMAAGANFGQLDIEAAANFRDAAAAAGVRRIIYLGGLVSEQPDSEHLRSRMETGSVLRLGEVPVTELRAGMIIGPGSAAFEVMRDLTNHLPVMITPRWVHSTSPPIALNDLMHYLVELASIDAAAGNTYDASGADVLSYADIIQILARLLGKRRLILPVPVLTPRLSARWLWLVTSVPVNIARALVDGLRQDVTADDAELRRLVPMQPLGAEAAIRQALAAEKNQSLPAHWVEGSMRCRNFEPRYAYYAKQAGAWELTEADPASLWQVLCTFGNNNDYFAMNPLWWLRGAGDWLLGGPSFRRKRRHASELRVGDVIDAWRVIGLQPQQKLSLLLEMKLPGSGVLEFTIGSRAQFIEISVCAYFHPAGVWGLLYWYPLVPFHKLIFKGMVKTIVKRAQALEASALPGASHTGQFA